VEKKTEELREGQVLAWGGGVRRTEEEALI